MRYHAYVALGAHRNILDVLTEGGEQERFIFYHSQIMFDPMSELMEDDNAQKDEGANPTPASEKKRQGGGDRGGRFADELHSVTIQARQRTFYIDLKKSNNGKFFKVSEKSRGGRKTTIMFDAEDLDEFITAFQEMKKHV